MYKEKKGKKMGCCGKGRSSLITCEAKLLSISSFILTFHLSITQGLCGAADKLSPSFCPGIAVLYSK